MAVKFKDTININGQYTLPLTDGTDGQVLVTDGAGNLTFSSESIAGSADSAESTHLNVKNTSGASIAKGTPVYVTGSVGNTDKLEIAPADASNASHMPAIGLLESTLADNGEGFVVQGGLLKGLITDTIDGSSSTANDTVYVKAGGGLTLTKPTGSTNFIQNIAKVARVHSSNGSLIVSSILRTNDVPNLSTGKIWVGDGNTIESTVVHVDETNGRLGIGTNSPTESLHVLSGGNISRFESTTATGNIVIKNSTTTTKIGSVSNNFIVDLDPTDSVASSNIILKSDGTERARFKSSGDVSFRDTSVNEAFYWDASAASLGLGTDSPRELLHIHTGDSGGVANNAADEVLVEGSGDTGITISSPSTNSGTLAFGDNDVSLRGAVSYNHSDDSMNFRVSSGTRMTIDSSGVVQVRNQTPTIQLYNTDASLGLNQTLGDIDFYQSDASDQGVGVVAKIKAINNSTFAGVGELAFHTGNTTTLAERLRIDYSGNVGIGTSSPSAKLHVNSNSYPETTERLAQFNAGVANYQTNRYVELSNSFTGSGYTSPALVFKTNANASNQKSYGLIATSSDGSLSFQNKAAGAEIAIGTSLGTTEKMRIDSSGNVGIGTDSPSAKLDIKGDGADIFLQSNDFKIARIQPRGTGANLDKALFSLFDGSTENVRIDTEGNSWLNGGQLGIGTTSPSSYLEVETAGSSGSDDIAVFSRATYGEVLKISRIGGAAVLNAKTNLTLSADYTGLQTSVNSNIIFETNATEKMRIDSSGRVGIGTDSPDAPLTVKGETFIQETSGGNAALRIQYGVDGNTALRDRARLMSVGYHGKMELIDGYNQHTVTISSTGNSYLNGGNVGIGTTSPDFKTHLYDSGNTVLGITAGTTNYASLQFGSTSDTTRGAIEYYTGDDSLRLKTGNNNEKMRIDSSGNVGIGTDNPNFLLTLNAPTGGALQWQYNGGSYLRIEADSGGGSYYAAAGFYHRFFTSGAERMRIDSSGNVGIGTTSPSQKLTVVGNAYIAGGLLLLDNNQPIQWGNSQQKIIGNNSGYLQFITSNSEKMRIDSSGNVGINVTDPDAQLEIVNSSGGSYRLGYSGGTDSYFDSENFYIRSGNGGSNKLIVNSSGKVGIGTTSPSHKLEVSAKGSQLGSSGYYINSSFNDTDNNVGVFTAHNDTSNGVGAIAGINELAFITYGTSWGERMRISSGGNIGIGTTNPAYKLDISGSLRATTGSFLGNIGTSGSVLFNDNQGINFGNSNAKIYGSSADGIKFNGNGSEKMRLTQAGNLGVGTDSPATNLHILSTASTPTVRIESTHPSGIPFLDLKGAASSQIRYIDETGTIQTRIDMSDNGGFSFVDVAGSSSPHMVINSSGNVGIGTSSARSILETNGTISINDSRTSITTGNTLTGIDIYTSDFSYNPPSGRLSMPINRILPVVEHSDGDAFGMAFYTAAKDADSVERLRIDSSGVTKFTPTKAYGDTSSSVKIFGTFTGTNYSDGSHFNLVFGDDDATNGYMGSITVEQLNPSASTASEMRFYTNAGGGNGGINPRMVIDEVGNVGIGTTAPQTKLHITNAITISNVGSTNDTTLIQFTESTNYDEFAIKGDFAGAGGENKLKFTTDLGGGDILVMKGNGNVGIGTTNPTSTLHLESASSPVLTIKDTTNSVTLLAYSQDSDSHIGTYSNHSLIFDTNSTERMRITSGGNVTATVDMRAPTFYDSNNTGYYMDMQGGGKLNGNFEFAANTTSTSYQYASIELRESNYTGNSSATPPFIGFHWGGVVASSIRLESNGTIAIVDNPGTDYENFKAAIMTATVDMRAPIFYDSDNTSYYCNPTATSRFNSTTTNQVNVAANAAYAVRFWNGSQSYSIRMSQSSDATYGGRVAGETTSDYNMYFTMAAGTNRGFVFKGSNTTSGAVAGIDASGNGRFIGDVVAYSSSDEKLKDNKKNIDNALEKVESLNGVEFDWNDKQDVYEGHDIGVIAQEVEKIAPEIVSTRDSGYKAVKYEKLVPLLIEAVKELSEKVKILENK